jgi:hypothetical protein
LAVLAVWRERVSAREGVRTGIFWAFRAIRPLLPCKFGRKTRLDRVNTLQLEQGTLRRKAGNGDRISATLFANTGDLRIRWFEKKATADFVAELHRTLEICCFLVNAGKRHMA